MRRIFGFLSVCALGVMPMAGCSEATPECQVDQDCDDQSECTEDRCNAGLCENTAVADGTACEGGTECTVAACVNGACESTPVADGTACGNDAGACQRGTCQVACTEQGIRDAIAAGGGPYTFGCVGPTMVVTEAEIVVDNDVVLDGEGNLSVDGNEDHRVFFVNEGVTAGLSAVTIARGRLRTIDITERDFNGGCIRNEGVLTLANSTVTECFAPFQPVYTHGARHGGRGGGIHNGIDGTMTLTHSTVSNNVAGGYVGGIDNDGVMTITNSTVSGCFTDFSGGGIANHGTLTVTNSTVSGNTADEVGGGIDNDGTLTMTNSTVSGNTARFSGGAIDNWASAATLTNTLVGGDCEGAIISGGYNIESPGNTCGFDHGTDQPETTTAELNLGPLQDNGGTTMTHALLTEPTASVAIDQIPKADCVHADGLPLTTDQRGLPRPVGNRCDVGAYEVQP